MHQSDPYILTTLLSSAVILVMGLCLLLISVPREPGLQPYRISRRLIAMAYMVLAAVGQWEVWGGIAPKEDMVVMAFTLIVASLQAGLFTFSIITLINMGYMTVRRVWTNTIPVLTVSVMLLIVLFMAPERVFYTIFYVALVLYCFQLGYYISLFAKQYKNYRLRFDNFFAGDEYDRLRWIRSSFYMSA